MAKEEKPLEYQRRIRDTKGVAQRLDLGLSETAGAACVCAKRITWARRCDRARWRSVPLVTGFGGSRRAVMNGPVSAAHAVFENSCESCHTQASAACRTPPARHATTARRIRRSMASTAHIKDAPHCAQCHLEHQGAYRAGEGRDRRTAPAATPISRRMRPA